MGTRAALRSRRPAEWNHLRVNQSNHRTEECGGTAALSFSGQTQWGYVSGTLTAHTENIQNTEIKMSSIDV